VPCDNVKSHVQSGKDCPLTGVILPAAMSGMSHTADAHVAEFKIFGTEILGGKSWGLRDRLFRAMDYDRTETAASYDRATHDALMRVDGATGSTPALRWMARTEETSG
jgi:hypothetical protein